MWATKETGEKNVSKAVMVPLIISHDGAVHKDTVRQGMKFTPVIKVDRVQMAQNVLLYNVVIWDPSSHNGSGPQTPGG